MSCRTTAADTGVSPRSSSSRRAGRQRVVLEKRGQQRRAELDVLDPGPRPALQRPAKAGAARGVLMHAEQHPARRRGLRGCGARQGSGQGSQQHRSSRQHGHLLYRTAERRRGRESAPRHRITPPAAQARGAGREVGGACGRRYSAVKRNDRVAAALVPLEELERLDEVVQCEDAIGAGPDRAGRQKVEDLGDVPLVRLRVAGGPAGPDAARDDGLLDQQQTGADRLLAGGEAYQADPAEGPDRRDERGFEQLPPAPCRRPRPRRPDAPAPPRPAGRRS